MTVRLEEALRRVESLSPEQQDSIADQILETIADDAAWEERFALGAAKIQSLADEAIQEHRRGETRRLDELIG